MKSITFECKVVTPLFLAGADGRSPELRPPSIKGVIRFWWRAMYGNLPLKVLKEREAKLFGASEEKFGRSKVIIRVDKQPTSNDIANNLTSEISKDQYPGICYLLYSTMMGRNIRPYIKHGTPLSITLASSDDNDLQEAINSFACLTFFGGLGTRSRRGAGSIHVKNIINESNGNTGLFNTDGLTTKEELKSHIESNFKKLLASVSSNRWKYSILKDSNLIIFDAKRDWKAALETIGKPFERFRYTNRHYVFETPNFGFPIQHGRFLKGRDGRPLKLTMGAGPGTQRDNRGNVEGFLQRRSSPLLFKVLKTKEDVYFPAIIWLEGELIPSNYRILDRRARKDNSGTQTEAPSAGIINDFLKELPKNKVEVTL